MPTVKSENRVTSAIGQTVEGLKEHLIDPPTNKPKKIFCSAESPEQTKVLPENIKGNAPVSPPVNSSGKTDPFNQNNHD